MYVICLASDYDGTLAHDGAVDQATVEALERLKRSGRKLLLVAWRELPDLVAVGPRLDLFNRVVAENGALIDDPATAACAGAAIALRRCGRAGSAWAPNGGAGVGSRLRVTGNSEQMFAEKRILS